MEWISVDERMPTYGKPVLIVIRGIVQDVTYMRDGADDCDDWFEPYFFEHDHNCKVSFHEVSHWMPLPEPQK